MQVAACLRSFLVDAVATDAVANYADAEAALSVKVDFVGKECEAEGRRGEAEGR